jgi:RHS repeat-associated protein
VYDYFIKDHLGNVRSTVTAQPINAAYLAGHEISMANVEQLIFDNIPNVRDGKPGSINPNDGMAAGLIAEVSDKRIGTAVLLKVMPGDRFTIDAQSYYEDEYTGTETVGSNDVVESLLSVLLGGNTYAGVPIGELSENARTIKLIFEAPNLAEKLNTIVPSNYNAAAPKAHLNYLFFDDNLQLVADLSGKIQVSPNGAGTSGWQMVGTGTEICNCTAVAPGSSGYIAIYVDNQSLGKKVWFDDLHIEHYTSEVLEEDHYYPFGLTVQLDQNASVQTEQPYKLTTKELETAFDLNIYDFGARMQDMQLGRWWGVDPLAEKWNSYSPYNYVLNNPINLIDLDGRDAKQTGAGTKDDPLVITAKYFYQNGTLNKDEIEGLEGATSAYNNLGVHESKDKKGNKVFVRYNLSKEGVDDVAKAIEGTEFTAESADGIGEMRTFGNEAKLTMSGDDDYGEGNRKEVGINREKISSDKESNYARRIKSTWIHEIGHNLGGNDEDGSSVMEQSGTRGVNNQIGSDIISPVYPQETKKFTPIILNKVGTPRLKSEGRIFIEKR